MDVVDIHNIELNLHVHIAPILPVNLRTSLNTTSCIQAFPIGNYRESVKE